MLKIVSTARVPFLGLAALLVLLSATPAVSDTLTLALFERYLESLRQAAGIPGLSVAIASEGRVVWERGLGLQDVENAIHARPDTPYPIGDLTQTFAGTLLLQCVERGRLDLESPVRLLSESLAGSRAEVRHVLAHTADDPAGQTFRYDPARFAALVEVSNRCTGFGFRKVMVWEILEPLAMFDSVPGADVGNPAAVPPTTFDRRTQERFARVLAQVAIPYKVDKKGRPSRSDLTHKSIDTSTGLISTVRDLAQYDAGLSDGRLLTADSLARAWTNATTASGARLPSGLGWFVQTYENERLIWHFGTIADGYSSLMLKLPRRHVTLIMLANSDGLNAASLAAGDVTVSPFARVFLRLFL